MAIRPIKTLAPITRAADTSKLLSASSALRDSLAGATFDTDKVQLARDAIFSWVARGGVGPGISVDLGGIDLSPRVPTYDLPGTIGDIPVATIPDDWITNYEPTEYREPFLHVTIKVRPQHASDPAPEYHYSDIDRPIGRGADQIQLDGRVIDLSYAGRRLAADYGLARNTCTIRLANNDRALDKLFRNTDWLRMLIDIRVGYRTIPPRFYKRVGPIWRVDRVSSITPDYVELQLIDATEGRLGYLRPIPSKRDVADLVLGQNQIGKSFMIEGVDNPYAEVPFGGEWVRAFKLRTWSKSSGSDGARWTSDYTEVVLGITRNPSACPGTIDVWRLCHEPHKVPDSWNFKLAYLENPNEPDRMEVILGRGVTAFPKDGLLKGKIFSKRFVHTVDDPVIGRVTTDWYAVILQIEETVTAAGDVGARASWLGKFRGYAKGKLLAQWPGGAEGVGGLGNDPWQGKHDPASIIQEICARYMINDGRAIIHKPSFERVRQSFGWDGYGFLAGVLSGDRNGATPWGAVDATEFISELAKTWKVDLFWGADGLLHIARTDTVSLWDMLNRVPGCPVYDATNDVIRDSWQEHVPLGSERHGLTNKVNIDGLKWYTPPTLLGSWDLDEDHGDLYAWERTLEGDRSFAWFNTATVVENGEVSSAHFVSATNDRPFNVVTFNAPLYALELELGDFFRVTHYAGRMEEGGYDQRLFMVEEIGLEWGSKQVRISAVDLAQDEALHSAVLDDGANWNRISRDTYDGVNAFNFKAGSKLIDLEGEALRNSGIKVGDLILHDEDGIGRHANLEVVDVSGLQTYTTGSPFEVPTADWGAVGSVEFDYTPDGLPDTNSQYFLDLTGGTTAGSNAFWLRRNTSTGQLILGLGGSGYGTGNLTWESGRTYRIRLAWDFGAANAVRVFVDGVQVLQTNTIAVTGWDGVFRDYARIGASVTHEPTHVAKGTIRNFNPAIVVDEAPSFSAKVGAFKVQRTKLDPPTDAEKPGRYPFGSDMYLCAADPETKQFTNGLPAFKIA